MLANAQGPRIQKERADFELYPGGTSYGTRSCIGFEGRRKIEIRNASEWSLWMDGDVIYRDGET